MQDEHGVTRIRNADPDDGEKQPRDKKTFLLLSGPNQQAFSLRTCSGADSIPCSNLFGKRDPKTYGTTTMAQIEQRVTELGKELGVKVQVVRGSVTSTS